MWRNKIMNRSQRTGLWIMLTTLVMVVVFTGDPELTKGHWIFLKFSAFIMSGAGAILLISE